MQLKMNKKTENFELNNKMRIQNQTIKIKAEAAKVVEKLHQADML